MPRALTWLLALLLPGAFVAAAAALLLERAAAGLGMPAYSVYSEAPDGLGAAAYVLRELGWAPVALTRPVQNTGRRGLLVLAEPQGRGVLAEEGGLNEAEAAGLLLWVAEGNALLLCGHQTTALHRALGVTASDARVAGEGRTAEVPPDEAGAYTRGVDRVRVQDGLLLETAEGLPLWRVGDRPGAVLLGHGRGRVLVVADPGLLTWDGLRGGDNAVFLANVAARHARDGRVYFDEYHHGFRSAGGLFGYAQHHGQSLLSLPLLAALAAAAWAVGVRLGPAVPAPTPESADAVEYASALARLYQRAGARRRLARTLACGFLDTLTRHLRLRRNALPVETLRAWRRNAPGPSDARLEALLRGAAGLRKGDVSERELLAWARAFGQFTDETMSDKR
jgi:hypothetical protein